MNELGLDFSTTRREAMVRVYIKLSPLLSLATNLGLVFTPQNRKLNKLNKQIEAILKFKQAFETILRISIYDEFVKNNGRAYIVCEQIFVSLLSLDDFIDSEEVNSNDILYRYPGINNLNEHLKLLFGEFGYENWQRRLIYTWVNEIISDIIYDSEINQQLTKSTELFSDGEIILRQCYPSTMIGLAIGLGLLDRKQESFFEENEFQTLISYSTIIARLCDDLVSEPDNRNLLLNHDGKLKQGLDINSIFNFISSLYIEINKIIDESQKFTLLERKMVRLMSQFYIDYAHAWLNRNKYLISATVDKVH